MVWKRNWISKQQGGLAKTYTVSMASYSHPRKSWLLVCWPINPSFSPKLYFFLTIVSLKLIVFCVWISKSILCSNPGNIYFVIPIVILTFISLFKWFYYNFISILFQFSVDFSIEFVQRIDSFIRQLSEYSVYFIE